MSDALTEQWRRSEPVEITVHSRPDGFDRQSFTATWLDTNVGPACNERGRRGQNFHTVLADHVAGWEAQGFTVHVAEGNTDSRSEVH